MKKIVGILAVAAMATSMFAVDISSTIRMSTTLAGNNGDDVNFLTLNHKDQKDSDALAFSANGEKAGANFQLWFTYDGTDSTKDGNPVSPSVNNPVRIRNVNLWIKPVDMLKVTVGDVAMSSYKERIFWWHGVYGAAPGSWGAFGGNYVEGNGAVATLNPIDGLTLEAGLLPGVDNAFVSTAKGYGYKTYAVKAGYNFNGGSATVIFADKGKDAQKLIGIGGDYSANGFYGFLNATINLSKDGLAGIAFDNYEEYATGAFKIQSHLPIVLFKNGADMNVGMLATVKASYAVGGFVPYLMLTTEPDGDAGWNFNAFNFALTVKPGVTCNVGAAAIEAAARFDITKSSCNWSIPVDLVLGL